jgi:hypothetical protein
MIVRLFVSYARSDVARVQELHDNLTGAAHEVWFDREMRGGSRWWDEILQQIRESDVFIFVMSPDSVTSRACRRELSYADALNKSILPILIHPVPMEEAPDQIQLINVIDLINPQGLDWMQLGSNINDLPVDRPLPEPLPNPPKPPIADLTEARAKVASDSLTGKDQKDLIDGLREAVTEEDDRDAVLAVLEDLRDRDDLLEKVADEIDEVLTAESVRSTRPISPLIRSLVAELKQSRCTPVLGAGMTDWLFGSRRDLAQKWASEYPFPMTAHWSDDLPQVTQYAATTYTPTVLRQDLGEFYREQLRLRYPTTVDAHEDARLGELALAVWKAEAPQKPAEPHRVLAELPCPIYVTAQASSMLVQALQDVGKNPVTGFCRWNDEIPIDDHTPLDPSYEPSVDEPLVYHVFGTLDVPESLVITEDEYFDFLAAVSRNLPGDPLIPAVVQEALAESSLLFLGFGLQDWDLRILLRALVNPVSTERKARNVKHVAAEIDMIKARIPAPEQARNYIVSYFQEHEPKIYIEWASVDQFASDLSRGWEAYG